MECKFSTNCYELKIVDAFECFEMYIISYMSMKITFTKLMYVKVAGLFVFILSVSMDQYPVEGLLDTV